MSETVVKIFVGSSLVELYMDRKELGDFFGKLNDIYAERGVRFKVFFCEDESAAMAEKGKQEEYNQQVRESQVAFFLFFNKAGEYTLREFDVAYQHFMKTKKLAIVICFRQGQGYEPHKSVLDFMSRLDADLGHYYRIYQHADSIKLCLLMQLKLMNLDVPVEFRNGKAVVAGQEVMTLEHLPMLLKNADYQRLRAACDESEQAFQAAKAAYLKNPEDDSAYLAAGEKRNKAKKALEELEDALFSLVARLEETGAQGQLTPRQREAYALLEQGNPAAASAMLPEKEIEAEADRGAAMADHGRKLQEQCVRELLSKIEIEKTRVGDPGRFERILRLYEKAAGREAREGLSKTAMKAYCVYLWKQRDYESGISWAEKLLKYMELEGTDADTAYALDILASLYNLTRRYPEAEAAYRRGLQIQEKLAKENPECQPLVSGICNNLGTLYYRTGRLTEAEEAFLRARAIREALAEKAPGANLAALASACNNLGNLYQRADRFPEAEKAYQKALDIREKLAVDNPGKYLPELAVTRSSLGMLYSKTGREEEAEKIYQWVRGVREKLAADNPGAYRPDLAEICNSQGVLYGNTGRCAEAETAYLKALALRKKLRDENPGAYRPALSETYDFLGFLYCRMERYGEAEAAYQSAREIREELAKENPEVYLPALADTCEHQASLYKKMGRDPETEAAYRRPREIRERLAQRDAKAHLPALAGLCNNQGVLYYAMGKYPEAEEAWKRARELREALAAENPEAYLPELGIVCVNQGILYKKLGDHAKAEENYQRAYGIRKELADKNPALYLQSLIDVCRYMKQLYSAMGSAEQADAMAAEAEALEEKLRALKVQ